MSPFHVHTSRTLTDVALVDRWTDDVILQKFHFCQVFRATDRVSQYIITNVIEKGPQDPKEVFFRVVLFDRFTKIETWEKLLAVSPSGEMEWDHFDNNIAFYEQSLHVLEAAPGTGRFQKPAPRKWGAGYDHVRSCLKLTQLMVSDNLHEKLLKMNYLRDAFDEIKNYPSFGDFSAFQLLIGLSYTEVLGRFSPNDFVALGPGAISGIKKMFHARDLQQAKRTLGEKVDLFADIVRHLTEHQDEWFKTFGLEFPGLGPDHLPLDMVDIEHSLCELDKYCRQAHPSLKGGKSITMPGKHTTSKVPLPREHTLPAVWSLPSRQIPRIRPAGVKSAKANMRYWVLGIVDDRLGSKGQEYKVQWVGYPGEDTWEPESLLTEDVPNLLDEYKASKTAKPISKKRKRK